MSHTECEYLSRSSAWSLKNRNRFLELEADFSFTDSELNIPTVYIATYSKNSMQIEVSTDWYRGLC